MSSLFARNRNYNCNNNNSNYNRHHRQQGNRVESEEDNYCTYVTRLERKTSMIDGPHFGNMQHAFQRVEVYEEEVYEEEEEEEVVVEEFETRGRFGRAKHMGQLGNNKGRENDRQHYEISKKNLKTIRA